MRECDCPGAFARGRRAAFYSSVPHIARCKQARGVRFQVERGAPGWPALPVLAGLLQIGSGDQVAMRVACHACGPFHVRDAAETGDQQTRLTFLARPRVQRGVAEFEGGGTAIAESGNPIRARTALNRGSS
jgi:hypothetical protein